VDISTLVLDQQLGQNEWAERCEYWQKKSEIRPEKRKRREKETQPLILTGHGISITVNRGTLLIRDGNTHYPAQAHQYRYFKGELSIPPRIVLVDGSGNITLDALDWMAAQKVDLIRLKFDGELISAINGAGYSADPKKVAWQNEIRANPSKRMAFAINSIKEKTIATLFNLENLLPASTSRDKAINQAKLALKTFRAKPPKSISQLLAIEGAVAQGYFFAWRALEIKWKAETRYPVPNEWKRYFSRSSLNDCTTRHNRNATHPINAMLNYAYKILESQTRIEVVAADYDPKLGILHDNPKHRADSFVFDMMEPERPVSDRAILTLVNEERFSGADLVLRKDGVCRMNQLLTRLIIERSWLWQPHAFSA